MADFDTNLDAGEGETPVVDVMSDGEGEGNPQAGATPAAGVKSVDGKQTKSNRKAPAKGKVTAEAQASEESHSGQEGGEGEGDEDAPDVDELVYDNWLGKQPVEVQELITRQQKALRAALVDEREQRKAQKQQLTALTRKLEGNTAATRELDQLKANLKESNRRAKFYESAPTDLTNPRLAYAAAQLNSLLGDTGDVDWDEMRGNMPELFRKVQVPKADAGSGSKQDGASTEKSMNSFIRAALGRE